MKLVQSAVAAAFLLSVSSAVAAQSPEPSPSAPSAGGGDENTIVRSQVPDTLMFTIDEVNEIQSRVAAGGQTADEAAGSAGGIENATLYLSTILYFGPENWTIWINGAPIGPRQGFQEFEVTAIDATSVELVVPLSAQGMRPIRLSPNQTFVARTGNIIEGPWK